MAHADFKDDGNMIADLAQFDLAREFRDAQQHKPWPSGLYSKTLVKRDDLRVVLISMQPGAVLKEHHADGSITVQVIEGELRFRTQQQEHALAAGHLLTLGRSIKHSVEAVSDAIFLLTISWPSGEELRSLPHRGYGT